MANIHSFPVQKQEEKHPSIIFPAADMLYNHFGPRINRMFAWTNRLRKIYAFLLFVCTHFLFWLPIMNFDPDDSTSFLLNKTNNPLTKYQLRDLAFINRCTLSSSITMDNIINYGQMRWILVLLCICSQIMLLLSLITYRDLTYEKLVQPYQWFYWFCRILMYLVISLIFNQLASVLGCRPIEIIYDIRCIILVIVLVIGFLSWCEKHLAC
ncbi:hypothetical protein I4U23_007278 [Adineta vaga]|nr:hypothetical protein I4U23_007278 [Adineta vaga]